MAIVPAPPDETAGRPIQAAQQQLFDRRSSARQKYAALIVGRPGWVALVHYELVMLIAQWVPGALGLALRKWLYPTLLGACGRGVVFGQGVVLRHPHKIRLGDNVVVDDHCLVDAKGETNRGITIGRDVFIGRNTILSCKNGDIDIEDAANLGFNCEVFSASRVRIGSETLLAAYSYLIGGDHDFADKSRAVLDQRRVSRGIDVGAGVWIGAGAKVLDGVVLGDRAVVGAGAVVRHAVPPGAVAVGVPARILDERGGTAPSS